MPQSHKAFLSNMPAIIQTVSPDSVHRLCEKERFHGFTQQQTFVGPLGNTVTFVVKPGTRPSTIAASTNQFKQLARKDAAADRLRAKLEARKK